MIISAKHIKIYYHVFLINNWQNFVTEQINILIFGGLYTASSCLNIGVVGDNDAFVKLQVLISNVLSQHKMPNKISYRHTTENTYEYITINWLKEDCDKENCYVFYHHTKGISKPENHWSYKLKIDWRKCMTYFNIEKWENMVEKLDQGFDTVGIMMKNNFWTGNFWWANSYWIKKLETVKKQNSRKQRFYYEFWNWKSLGGKLNPKIYDAYPYDAAKFYKPLCISLPENSYRK